MTAQFLLAVVFSAAIVVARRSVSPLRKVVAFVAALIVWSVANRVLVGDGGWYGVVAVLAGILVVQVPAYRQDQARWDATADSRYRERLASEVSGFPTAEAAVLATWPARADARVVATRLVGSRTAEVTVDTVPSRPVTVRCERIDSGWVWTEDVDL